MFELFGDFFVGSGGAEGAVPRPPVGIEGGVGRFGERAVSGEAVGERCCAVRRRAHERMPERDARTDVDQARVDCGRCVDERDAQRARRVPHDDRIARRLGRRQREKALRRRREIGDLLTKCRFDLAGTWPFVGHRKTARQFKGCQPLRPFDERERIATAFGDDATAYAFVEWCAQPRSEQGLRVGRAESFDEQLRKRCKILDRHSGREDERDVLGQQPARDERQRLRRTAIEPVRVVDDAQQRAAVCGAGEQIQDRESDEEPVGRGAGAQSERGPGRVALRLGQLPDAIEHRRTELVQTGERQLHLTLDTRGFRDREALRRVDEILQERGLADARFAAQHEHPALPVTRRLEERVKRLTFARTSDQGGHET